MTRLWAGAAGSAIAGLLLAGWQAAPAPPLPAGAAAPLVYADCQVCHTTEIIVQQRLSPAAWGKVVDKMIRWGAPVASGDRDVIVRYLADHFGSD